VAYSDHMATRKPEDTLASFAISSPSAVSGSMDRDLSTPAPGEQFDTTPSDLAAIDIEVVDPSACCLLFEEGPLAFGICLPPLESSITAKSSIPSDILDKDDDSLETLPSHIPKCYANFADVFSGKNTDKLPLRQVYDHSIDLEPNMNSP
jgi:hypothetical protein